MARAAGLAKEDGAATVSSTRRWPAWGLGRA